MKTIAVEEQFGQTRVVVGSEERMHTERLVASAIAAGRLGGAVG